MQQKKTWFRLDNAATIFPGQNTSSWSNVFRFSVALTEKIKPELLEQALVDVLPRFPCYDVQIRHGFFWYYFEKNPNGAPPVMPDIGNPCHRIKFSENKRYLFRVYYHENRISADFFHALTDGRGASLFVCTLAAQYLRLSGHSISYGGNVLDINTPAPKSETDDPFRKCEPSKGRVGRGGSRVYHYRGTRMPRHTVNITTGIMPLEDVHTLAKSYGVTITEFIGALLLYVHYEKQLEEKRKQKNVSVQIPVSLRKAFEIETLRNFSLTYNVRIDPLLGEYSFEEVLRQVSTYLRYINNKKTLRAMTTANLKLEESPFMRVMPLVIKNLAIGISFGITGEQSTSVLFSNLGRVQLPEDMQPFVTRTELMAGPGKINGGRCAACSYNDSFVLTFANIYKESDIERSFFTKLVKMGIHVKIESNRGID